MITESYSSFEDRLNSFSPLNDNNDAVDNLEVNLTAETQDFVTWAHNLQNIGFKIWYFSLQD